MLKISKCSAKEIAKAIEGELIGEDVTVSELSINSKDESNNSSIFFAIKGEKFDGHDFVDEAVANGARIVVSQKKIITSATIIKVNDTIRALGLFAKNFRKKTRVIGVTGSAGKTTVKNMIIAVLKQKYKVCGTLQNQNNEIGVPLTLLSAHDEDWCVVEMGMRKIGEINWLSYISEPEICVITNCGSAHIEYLKTRENILKAKMEIINSGPRVVFLPDEKRFRSYERDKTKFIYLDLKAVAKTCRYTENGLCFDVVNKDGLTKRVEMNTINHCNSKNAYFAYRVGEELGILHEKIVAGIKNFQKEKAHEDIVEVRDMTVILDCYNASYEGVKESLITLCKYAEKIGKKPCALLGDMLELGEHSKRLHLKIGEFCKNLGISKVYTYGNMSKEISDAFYNGMHLENESSAIQELMLISKEKYVLLVKGSRKMHMENIINKLREVYNE